MRRAAFPIVMSQAIPVILCTLLLGPIVRSASAQCFSVASVETVATGGVLGKISNPAYAFHRTRTPAATAIAVPDGVTISFNTNNIDGLPTRVYEFDVDGSGVTPGNVAVPLSSADAMPLYNVKAARALAETVSADPLSPVWAYTYPLGDDQYISYMWRTDSGYGATNLKGGTAVSNNAINVPGTFNYINAPFRSFVFVHGTNLNVGVAPTVRLVKADDAGVNRTGFVTLRTSDGLLLSCWFGIHKTTVLEALPDGLYNFEIEQAGCTTVVVPNAIRIVENFINDATMNTNLLGNWGSLNWQAVDDWLCPVWRHNNPYNDIDPVSPGGAHQFVSKKGSLYYPRRPNDRLDNPRQEPVPTGIIETNAWAGNTQGGDNEAGSLQWRPASGRRQMWQIVQTNFAGDTFCTLSGLWAGGTEIGAALTYGVEIRENDENGTILAQTPPRQDSELWGWDPFSQVIILQGGPRQLAIVIYGDNNQEVNAGLHVDELLLHAGADLWPDVDNDGDVDVDDFASFQLCYTGPGGLLPSDPNCPQLDRDGDGDLDETDFNAFNACSTRAGVALEATDIPPGCEL